jgi:hypothetical protein
MRIKLRHVRRYDDGNAGPTSFTLGSASLSDESGRLIGDLALLTRPHGDTESAVDFDEIERLANEAIELVIKRVDLMADQLGIVASESDELRWVKWRDDNEGLLRKPTRNEVINLEGESRLLWDSVSTVSYEQAMRLLAAFGIFCVERALDAETRQHVGTIIEMYSAAGVLLGHANYLLGCFTGDGTRQTHYKNSMRERGRRRWESDPTQIAKAEAQKLWQERHAGKHPKLGTNEKFATECMRRWPVLKSAKVILGWCTDWNKEAKQKNQSAS